MKRFVITENEKEQIKSLYQSKGFLNEFEEPEPVLTDATDTCIAKLQFKRGQEKFGDRVSKNIKDFIRTCLFSSLATIERFQNDKKFKLPPIVTFHVGTSSSGTDQENRITAQKRMEYLTGLYMDVMLKDGIREDIAYELMTQSDKSYKPADVNRNFYDETRVEDKPIDRVCYITIEPITTKGKNSNTIGKIGGQLIDASSFVNTYLYDNVDEDELTRGIQTLETYSDLKDIDTFLQNSRIGKLQDFLNDQLFDDPTHLSQIKDHINTIAKRSGKGTVSQIVDGKISIILENKIVKLKTT